MGTVQAPLYRVADQLGTLVPVTLADLDPSNVVSVHNADTTNVHGIADTARLITIDNIGDYASTPDLSAYATIVGQTAAIAASAATLVTLGPATQARNTIEPSADVVPLTVKGRTAGQSAHLQQWKQANGTLAMTVTRDGALQTLDGISAPYYSNRSNNEAYLQYDADSTHSLVVINRTSIGKVPLSVRGMASQSANLQEWQDSAATVLCYVHSGGDLRNVSGNVYGKYGNATVGIGSMGPASEPGIAMDNQSSVRMFRSAAGALTTQAAGSNPTLTVVKGTASQASTNLQEWQDSAGVVKAQVQSNGSFVNSGVISGVEMRASYYEDPGNVAGYLQMNFDSTHAIVALPKSASRVPFTVQGFASQSANLQEWQDSTAAVKLKVDPSGTVSAQGAIFAHLSSTVDQVRIGNASLQLSNDGTSIGKIRAGVVGVWKTTQPSGPTMTGAGFMIEDLSVAPSTNPVGGGIMYSEAGALKWRGTSGTVTTIANA